MKVALFSRYPLDTESPRGGVEAVTVVLTKALARLPDLDVHVVTLERGRKKLEVHRSDGATIHRLPRSQWPQLLDIQSGPGRKRLVHYLRDLAPDVVHSHETYGLALWDLDIPHVFTVHGFDHANLLAQKARHAVTRSWLWRRAERANLAHHRHIIAITPYVRQMIEPLTDALIHDIENPVDDRFFEVEPRPEPGRVLCVGWINERKNTLGAVEAMAQVVRRGIPAKLSIAGIAKKTDYLKRVENAIDRHGLQGRVEFLGQVPHSLLPRELQRASVMLLPSRQENSPMAIAEAMAAGVPVIASNRCGMPFMVRDGQTGYLVGPEDVDTIAGDLCALCLHPERAAAMGQEARNEALLRWQADAVAKRTADIYRTLVE